MKHPLYFLFSLFFILMVTVVSCSRFQAERTSGKESDIKALEITDKWVEKDTEESVKKILKQLKLHKGFQLYLKTLGRKPKIFIVDIQNQTSNPYFPIEDLNDELLNEFSASGEFILIDAVAREVLLKEVTYQSDGMVSPKEVKQIGKQAGADLLIFGSVRMTPHRRKGKTIKQYSVNLRMTDIERGIEVLRARAKVRKYSEQNSLAW